MKWEELLVLWKCRSPPGERGCSLSLCRALTAVCSPLGWWFQVKNQERSKTLPRPLFLPWVGLLCQEEKIAHQAGSDGILQPLPDSPTQRPEVRAVKAQAGITSGKCSAGESKGVTRSCSAWGQLGARSQPAITHTQAGRRWAHESTPLASFSSSVKWRWWYSTHVCEGLNEITFVKCLECVSSNPYNSIEYTRYLCVLAHRKLCMRVNHF